jgi:hypothetical protein
MQTWKTGGSPSPKQLSCLVKLVNFAIVTNTRDALGVKDFERLGRAMKNIFVENDVAVNTTDGPPNCFLRRIVGSTLCRAGSE